MRKGDFTLLRTWILNFALLLKRNISSLKEDSTSSKIRKIKEETTEKAKLLEQKTQVLLNKLEKDRRKLEDIQLEHNKAKREVEKLRSSISIYQQTACVWYFYCIYL